MKKTFSENENYRLVLELEEGHIFLHIKIFNWGKSVFKSIQEDMLDILERTKVQGWDEIYAYTENVKFANMVEPCEVVGNFVEKNKRFHIVKWITG